MAKKTTTRSLARVGPVQQAEVVELGNRASALMLSAPQWAVLLDQCQVVVKSGIVPKDIDTPEKLAAIALWGLEIGIAPMRAWQGAYLARGNLRMKSDLARALILERAPGATIDLVEFTEKKAVWVMARPGKKAKAFEFTMEQAEKAGLTKYRDSRTSEIVDNENYKKWPRQMLAARAFTMGANLLFSHILQGASIAWEIEDGVLEVENDPSADDAVVVLEQEDEPAAKESSEEGAPPGASDGARWDVGKQSTRAELPLEAAELNTIRERTVQLARLQLQKAKIKTDMANMHKRYKQLHAELYKRHIGDEPNHRPTAEEAVAYIIELEDRIRDLGGTPGGA